MKILAYWPAFAGGSLTLAIAAVCVFAVHTHDGSAVSGVIIGFLGLLGLVSLGMTVKAVKSIQDELILEAMRNDETTAKLRKADWPEQGKRPLR